MAFPILKSFILGFNYQFNALNPDEKSNELNDAFATMFRSGESPTFLQILQSFFPIFLAIVRTISYRSPFG